MHPPEIMISEIQWPSADGRSCRTLVDMASSCVSRTPNGEPWSRHCAPNIPSPPGGRLYPNGSATWWWLMPGSSSVSTSPVPRCATLPAALQTGNAGGSPAPCAAPPLAVANVAGQPLHDPHFPRGPKGEIPLGLPLNRKTISITQEGKTGEQNPSPSPSTETG